MTADDIDAQERAYFVNWRRELARLEEEEKLVLTPFEKNLEVWRQLWRVLERSHIVVQVCTIFLSLWNRHRRWCLCPLCNFEPCCFRMESKEDTRCLVHFPGHPGFLHAAPLRSTCKDTEFIQFLASTGFSSQSRLSTDSLQVQLVGTVLVRGLAAMPEMQVPCMFQNVQGM